MEETQKLFLKTVEIGFTYRGVRYKHKCQLPLTKDNKLLLGEPMKALKHSAFYSLKKADYLYKKDSKVPEESIYSLINQIEIFVII